MFVKPLKVIHSEIDFELFLKSKSCKDILDFVKDCAESIVGTKISDEYSVSPIISKFELFMYRLYDLIDEIPPIKQPMRFGNKAFRLWHTKMLEEVKEFLMDLLPTDKAEAAIEIEPYFNELFGNETRIDYGTGHELNFALIFLILFKINVIEKSDLKAVILKGFSSYARTMRRLQVDYMLEPAGSHGVWGLDDYHCLLFLWGSAQLANQNEFVPSCIHDPEILNEFSSEYLYFDGVKFIKKIKSSAPFAETSPMLNDISAIHDWARVCSGLMKLFQGEVLFKYPVAQHILFGSVLSSSFRSTSTTATTNNNDHFLHQIQH
jgi:hypothetical protein